MHAQPIPSTMSKPFEPWEVLLLRELKDIDQRTQRSRSWKSIVRQFKEESDRRGSIRRTQHSLQQKWLRIQRTSIRNPPPEPLVLRRKMLDKPESFQHTQPAAGSPLPPTTRTSAPNVGLDPPPEIEFKSSYPEYGSHSTYQISPPRESMPLEPNTGCGTELELQRLAEGTRDPWILPHLSFPTHTNEQPTSLTQPERRRGKVLKWPSELISQG